jgi:hypothetical protein
MGAIRQKRSHRTNRHWKGQAGAAPPLGTSTGHLKSMCATDLLAHGTRAPQIGQRSGTSTSAHRILNSKDGAVTRKGDGISAPQTTHGCAGHNARAVVCPHAPTAELSQALHQRYKSSQQGRLTPRPRSMTQQGYPRHDKGPPYTRPTSEMICAAPSCIRPLSQATKEPNHM